MALHPSTTTRRGWRALPVALLDITVRRVRPGRSDGLGRGPAGRAGEGSLTTECPDQGGQVQSQTVAQPGVPGVRPVRVWSGQLIRASHHRSGCPGASATSCTGRAPRGAKTMNRDPAARPCPWPGPSACPGWKTQPPRASNPLSARMTPSNHLVVSIGRISSSPFNAKAIQRVGQALCWGGVRSGQRNPAGGTRCSHGRLGQMGLLVVEHAGSEVLHRVAHP